MNSRERVQRAIKFQQPDRAPISHAVLPAAQLKYGEPLAEMLTEFREDFGWDYMTDLPLEKFPALYKPGRNRDDFGTVWHVEWAGICGIPVEWPIPDLEPLRRVSLAGGLHRRAAGRAASTAGTCAASTTAGMRAARGSPTSSSSSSCAAWKPC